MNVLFQPEIETMSRQKLEQLQLERLQQTVQRVTTSVPFYQEAFKAAGVQMQDIRSLADVARLPFTQKHNFRDHYPFGLFAVEQKDVVRLHGSSGTHGKPTVVGYTKRDIENWSVCIARAIVTAGGRPDDLFHIAYGYGLFTGGLGFHYGAEHLGMTVIPVSGGHTPRQISIIEDFRPRGIAGTPSYILNLAETMIRDGKDARKTSLEYGIFGAEPWTEEMRGALQDLLGITAVDVYGLSEVMGPGVGIECKEAQSGLHIAEDHFLIEIVNPQTGEPLPHGVLGEVVFTTLTKEALPVIRYRTGDLAYLYPEACCCGRTHVRMSRVKGRIDDMLVVRGVNVFPSEIEAVVFKVSEVAPNYQVVVDRVGTMDELTTVLEVTEAVTRALGPLDAEHPQYEAITARVTSEIQRALGIATKVQLCAPGTLPRSEGKAVRVVDRRNLYESKTKTL